jgi:AcrR family transcriptional regulator
MRPDPRSPRGSSRLNLVKAGIRVFAEKGFEGARIREIADLAGVNVSLVSFHYGGKEGLYRTLLRHAGRLVRRMMKALPGLPGSQDPDALPKAALALRAEVERFLRSGLEPPGGGAGPLPRSVRRTLRALVVREMAFPRPGGESVLREAMLQPMAYLEQCIRVLRPDLDDAGRLAMASTMRTQVVHLPGALEMLGPLRSGGADPVDLPAVIEHCLDFDLRGIGALWSPGSRWLFAVATGPGYYFRQSGFDLGYALEFRSTFYAARRLGHGNAVGISFSHYSNSGMRNHNPGAETVRVFYAFPVPWFWR